MLNLPVVEKVSLKIAYFMGSFDTYPHFSAEFFRVSTHRFGHLCSAI
jgi:hypothetical protein